MTHWMEDTSERMEVRWHALRKLLDGKEISDKERDELERFNKAEWFMYSEDVGMPDARNDLGVPSYAPEFDGDEDS